MRCITIVLAVAATLLAGCHAPKPSMDWLRGDARIQPPPTGSYGTSDEYYQPGGSSRIDSRRDDWADNDLDARSSRSGSARSRRSGVAYDVYDPSGERDWSSRDGSPVTGRRDDRVKRTGYSELDDDRDLRGRSSQERSRDDRRRVYEREYLEIDRDPRVRVIEASHDPRSEDRITAAVYRDDDERDRFRSTSRVREISELPPNGRRSRVPVLRVGETRPNSEVATSDRRDADPTWRRR